MEPCIRVGIDVGCKGHRVGVAGPDGVLLDEFDISHTREGFEDFFRRVGHHEQERKLPVAVAMEGFNGYARPLDREIRTHGWRLYNVNNLKLARFREVFPGPAKTDALDARKILELFHLQDHLPLAKDVLQEVGEIPAENEKLKRLSRRRRVLVEEKIRVMDRLQADLQAVSPGLLSITKNVGNLWFLRFLTSRDDLTELSRLRRSSVLAIQGIGERWTGVIAVWQKRAAFSSEVDYVGPMILADAKRILALLQEIRALDQAMAELTDVSSIGRRVRTIPGFGKTSAAELAGEIGTLDRFASESSLALYLRMATLDNQSGQYHGTKRPRQVNGRAKAAMMTAVARHIGCVPQSRAYYDKKRAEGKRHNQAVRALGRHLVRVIWSMLRQERDYELRDLPPAP